MSSNSQQSGYDINDDHIDDHLMSSEDEDDDDYMDEAQPSEEVQGEGSNASTTGRKAAGRKIRTKRKIKFDTYLRTIQKEYHPSCKIAAASLYALNSIVRSLFNRIIDEAVDLAKKQRRPTLMPRDIEYSCRFLLPRELYDASQNVATQAVARYTNSFQ
ncbi:histone-fold-containing protein [Halteromyces radiatus]|uniref:histone-fold-containing protein n=1 Tax=Halteromyces radiatus TaxID=101107 RepID=UPI0022200ED2|nr:histone-fold-containing protein [Halteromyces radiatus]KAI8092866.1 histone-fold-containing protein [Halteromyces radiatus]